ncbi:hypothetical protein H0H92_005068 [Tricholoma furcatifolium]|nr:hypothetical protein H0H92_005068 [Tricholoma furcatifolium]
MQMFGPNAAQPSTQTQQQSSPTSSINSGRSPPAAVTVQRLLPTPPHPPPANIQDMSPDRLATPPPATQHTQSQPHYPRPIHRGPPPQFISKYQNLEQENWEVTEELLADIERADLQQAQAQAQSNLSNNYSSAYLQNQAANSPPKDPAVERVRSMERASPKEPDIIQQQRRQQAARESPKARERQPTSPTAPTFSQPPSQSPERRSSPFQSVVPNEHPTGYIQYTREPPPTVRRTSNVDNRQNAASLASSLATQTPPLQTITARTPDRSLPVQEELEDEPAKAETGTRQAWQEISDEQQHVRHTGGSPTPSSDLNPEAGYSEHHRNGHREENGVPSLPQDNVVGQRREHVEDDDINGYTPRSPTADLPEHPPTKYYQAPPPPPPHPNVRAAQAQAARRHTRNGSTDQLGLPSFDPSVFEGDTNVLVMNSEMPPQYTEPPRRQPQLQQQQPQLQASNQPSNEHYPNLNPYPNQPQPQPQTQYRQPKTHADELQHYDSSYMHAYYASSRPDAPVPPTLHSQTAAPSPSPMVSDRDGKDEFSPVAPVGSPYPYPFNHVRRNHTFSGHPNRPHMPTMFNPEIERTTIQQQVARQWEVYAHNHQYSGNISDSTFSPASTPFEGGGYTPWALLHTNRTLGRPQDIMSLRSSPSHEPISLPTPPPMIGVKKALRPKLAARRHHSSRKPPPRVESTQPRETSPEPSSSSGEETAGEERLGVPEDGNWSTGTAGPIIVVGEDGKDEWVDEEDEEDDLLELEYHQNYVTNAEKRRRRWEVGWEALAQALQTLDRQTDATIVVMAAPSHSTKLYSATSRSVRRQSGAAASAVSMKEMRTAFSRIASERRKSRSQRASLVDRFLNPTNASGGDGSDGSSESREEDLKRALEAALGSLASLGGIYEQREARWHEEMRRITEDRERVEMLLKQVLGESPTGTNISVASRAPSLI